MKKLTYGMIIATTLLTLLFLGVFIPGASAGEETAFAYREHRVKPGDTLWGIAKEYTKGNRDIRKYIYSIMRDNEMESPDIMPGQILLIPPQ